MHCVITVTFTSSWLFCEKAELPSQCAVGEWGPSPPGHPLSAVHLPVRPEASHAVPMLTANKAFQCLPPALGSQLACSLRCVKISVQYLSNCDVCTETVALCCPIAVAGLCLRLTGQTGAKAWECVYLMGFSDDSWHTVERKWLWKPKHSFSSFDVSLAQLGLCLYYVSEILYRNWKFLVFVNIK